MVAESLAVKHQLLIMKRAHRAPNLTAWDRLVLGGCALFVSPKRLSKMAVILKLSTLLCFHHALVKRKYLLLYSPRKCRRSGPTYFRPQLPHEWEFDTETSESAQGSMAVRGGGVTLVEGSDSYARNGSSLSRETNRCEGVRP